MKRTESYWGATVVAGVFKSLAVVWVLGGIYVASQLANNQESVQSQASAVVGGVILGTWCAFFGYVISLLRDIATQGRPTPEQHLQHHPASPAGEEDSSYRLWRGSQDYPSDRLWKGSRS